MIGNILLTLAFLASVFSVIMYYFTYRGYENTLKMARIGYHAMAVMVIAASALLLHAILTHQYEYKYVFNYSGSDLSTGLLMSTFWAGQEGSFLLWVFFTAIIGLILLEYTAFPATKRSVARPADRSRRPRTSRDDDIHICCCVLADDGKPVIEKSVHIHLG